MVPLSTESTNDYVIAAHSMPVVANVNRFVPRKQNCNIPKGYERVWTKCLAKTIQRTKEK